MATTAVALARETRSREQKLLTPPLKWAGGKRWQLPHVRKFWESQCHRRLVEPFCGGLAVTLGLTPEQALLNDVNPHLMSFYGWLKRGLTTAVPMANEEAFFYEQRERFNRLLKEGRASSSPAWER